MGLLPTAKLSSQSDRQSGRQTSNNVAGTLYPDPMRTSTTSCRCTTVNITMYLTYPMSVWDTVTYHDVIMSHVTCIAHIHRMWNSHLLWEKLIKQFKSPDIWTGIYAPSSGLQPCLWSSLNLMLTSSSSENMSNVNDSHVRQMNWNARQGNVHQILLFSTLCRLIDMRPRSDTMLTNRHICVRVWWASHWLYRDVM